MNRYLVLKEYTDPVYGERPAGSFVELDEKQAQKLIKQGVLKLSADLTMVDVAFRYRGLNLELYNTRTGNALLRFNRNGILDALIANIIGNVQGNVTGNVTGNVIGDLTGTANKALALEWGSPVNAKAASATIGAGEHGTVTVTAVIKGLAGNDLDIVVSDAGDNDCAMTAGIADGIITVTLGKTGAALEPTKNTATLVADAVNALAEVAAVASGDGSAPLVAAEASKDFIGGQDGTEGTKEVAYIDSDRIYICTADNTINDANWKRIPAVLETY